MEYLRCGTSAGLLARHSSNISYHPSVSFAPLCSQRCDTRLHSASAFRERDCRPCDPRGHAANVSLLLRHRRAMHIAAAPQTGEPATVSEDNLQVSYSVPEPEPPWRPTPVQGAAIMFGVAVLWGTSPVCTRFLYLTPEPPSSAVLAAVQSTTSALVLGLIYFLQKRKLEKQQKMNFAYRRSSGESSELAALTVEEQSSTSASVSQTQRTFSWNDLLQYPFPVPNQIRTAGLEIGCWCFMANVATLMGFSMTTAAQGAFVLRLTSIFTPVCSLLVAADSSPRLAWLAALLALGGGLVLGLDSPSLQEGPFHWEALHGNLLVLLAAALWSLQTVRQGQVLDAHLWRRKAGMARRVVVEGVRGGKEKGEGDKVPPPHQKKNLEKKLHMQWHGFPHFCWHWGP
eukprot:jgi/Botrbrau1/19378/Bobra.0338s0009.3